MKSSRRHTDSAYEEELRTLSENITMMAGHVEQMISSATNALVTANATLARETIANDRRVNRLEIETDDLCLRVLARRQPVASDLRFITFTLKMVTDLERIGDLAVNISERAIDMHEQARSPTLLDGIVRMSEIVQSMIGNAIDSFVNRDAVKARSVIESDDEVDDFYHEVFGRLLGEMGNKNDDEQQAYIHVMSVAKWFERIGDHSVNIAEMVIFMVEGQDIRHRGKLADERRGGQ